jgi:Fe-S cluster assembly protein SufD
MSQLAQWISDGVARSVARPEVPWLHSLRSAALDRFVAEGWPSTRQEAWRHTSLAVLEQHAFTEGSRQGLEAAVARLRNNEAGHWLVFANGVFMPELSAVGSLPEGAVLCPVSQALSSHGETIQALYGTADTGSSVAALNAALAGDGAFVQLHSGCVLDLPVHLVFVATGSGAVNAVRNVIHAHDGSQATIVEHYIGNTSQASFTSSVTRARIDSRARITHLKLQQEDVQAFHLGCIDVQQGTASVFNSHAMSFGARLARTDIATEFNGDYCETLLNGLYYVDGKRHVDHHTSIGHNLPHGVSREYYRGILGDQARGVFAGRIRVAPGADKTDAVQRSDSLLLSRLARSDARPELEIYADDVKCAHGATVGQISPESLFYLRSRGLSLEHARNVLTYAFAAQAIERIESPTLRARVVQAIGALAPHGSEATHDSV